MPAKRKFKIYTHFFYKEKLRTYDVDNYRILGKSVEIKVSSKMAGYKMNLPFNAEYCVLLVDIEYKVMIIYYS